MGYSCTKFDYIITSSFVDCIGAVSKIIDISISSITAAERIISDPTNNRIITITSINGVIATSTVDGIIIISPVDGFSAIILFKCQRIIN